MIYFIEDTNQYQITITDLWRTWVIPKFRIEMTVSEPYLYINWNDREKGAGGDERTLQIDYLDVVDGYGGYVDNPASATALMATIEAMIVSGFSVGGDVLTAKADLLSHDGVSDTILPGGTNEYILSRDNTTQTGLAWIPNVGLGGDVVGPGSATDDRIATFDGATGKLIQDGGYTIAQLLARPRIYPLGQTGALITHTGTAVETKVWSLLIPANTIGNNDTIEVQTLARRTTGAGSITVNVYLNDTDNLTTPTLIGQVSTAASQTTYSRNYQKWLNVANSSVGVPTTGIASVFGAAPYTTTYANTSDIYVVIALTLSVGADVGTLYNVQVNHIKN